MTNSHGNLGLEQVEDLETEFKMIPFAGAPKEKAGGDGKRQQHGSSDGTFCLCLYLPSIHIESGKYQTSAKGKRDPGLISV